MTPKEFSDNFDILFSPNQNGNLTIDEFQKSLYLTTAQSQIINEALALPSSQGQAQVGFGSSSKRTIDLASITRTAEFTPIKVEDAESPYPTLNVYKVELTPNNSEPFNTQVLSYISENIIVSGATNIYDYPLQIIQLTDAELKRAMSSPYAGPLKRQAWKIITAPSGVRNAPYHELDDGSSDVFYHTIYLIIHPGEVASSYNVIYLKRPQPIILVDLNGLDLSIEGCKDIQGCELDPSVHQEILERAVTLAKAAASNTTMTAEQQKQKQGNRKENQEEE